MKTRYIRNVLKRIMAILVSIGVITYQVDAFDIISNTRRTVSYRQLTDEQKKNLDYWEKAEFFQLDEDVLKELSTNELFELVSYYPMSYVLFWHDTPVDGIKELSSIFNGLEELLKRDDLVNVLYNDYINKSIPRKTQGKYTIKENEDCISVFCDDDSYLKNDMSILVRDYIEEGVFSIEKYSCMLSENEKDEIMLKLIENIKEKSESDLFDHCAFSYLYDYIQSKNSDSLEKIVNDKSIHYYYDDYGQYRIIYVKTPHGNNVKCKKYTFNHYNSTIVNCNVLYNNPDIVLVNNGYSHNNCHAYAWAYRNDVVIEDPGKYMSDGSYQLCSVQNSAVAYWGSHSARVYDANNYSNYGLDPIITSKMGMGGSVLRGPMRQLGYMPSNAVFYRTYC